VTLVIGAGGGASPEVAAKNAELKRRSRRRRRQPRRQPRRGHCKLHARRGAERRLLRLLLQHRLLRNAEEGLRQGGSGVQEGDRDQAGLRRGLQRARHRLQPGAQVRSGAAASAKAMELSGSGAAGAAGGATRCDVQPGCHPLDAGKIADAKKQFEGAIRCEPEPTGPSRTTSWAWRL